MSTPPATAGGTDLPFLLPRFEDAVEWRLGGAAELFEAAFEDNFAEFIFRRDRAERGAAERERVRRAAERRGRGERAPDADGVEVPLNRVARHPLDDERAAPVRDDLGRAPRRADGVAHVVQAVEEAD